VNPTVTQNTNTTHRVEVRTQILVGKEEELKLKLVEAKQKIQEQPLVDDFEMSRILELDAELFALMTERYALERAEATRLYFVTYHQVLEETLRQMTERLSGHRQSSTSQMSNEIHIRRHFALLERINRLRDILTYNQDA
jgi:hypothetical protein